MKRIYTFCAVAMLLASCMRPTPYSPSICVNQKRFGADVATSKDNMATVSWRELFKDPYLQKLIEQALDNNTDVQTARLRVRQAEAEWERTRLSFLPSLGLSAESGVSKSGNSTVKETVLGINASWEIDAFGRLQCVEKGAEEELEAKKAAEQAARTQMVATVAELYYTLLLADEQISIDKKTLVCWAETVHAMELLKTYGDDTTEAAVQQARANSMALESSILTKEKERRLVETTLCTLLGEEPRNIPRGSLNQQHFPDKLMAGVPLQLLHHRPDVREAEHQLAQAVYATEEARCAFYPSITLSGNAGWKRHSGDVEVNPAQWLSHALGSLVQPILSRGENEARLKHAKAEQEISLLAFRQALLTAGGEVNNALTAYHTARKKYLKDIQQVATLREAVKNTELLMQHSSGTYLEVLTAQQSLLEAKQSVVQDCYDKIRAVIELYHALGGGIR